MEMMSSSTAEPIDLLDLKLLPAWVKEPEARSYEHYAGEEEGGELRSRQRPPRSERERRTSDFRSGEHSRSQANKKQPARLRKKMGGREYRLHEAKNRPSQDRHAPPVTQMPPEITIRFLPYALAFDNVVAQIKSGSVAYSVFALARLFLEKPERYEVCLTAKTKSSLYQLGEGSSVSLTGEFLERNAFRFACENFYKIDITQSDPIKGNFSNVARCRLSGTLLGPTNHHNYQPQLRSLYEQRFSRRMSFADYQRQIEIANDPALIERWKEEARTVTTYTTSREETPSIFSSAAEAERHFRSKYLTGLLHSVAEVIIGGVLSRRLHDRALDRAIEDAWTREVRSPSNMMQELASRMRQSGLNVFRHRRGMLFVSPIRVRPFVHAQAEVSSSVNAILGTLAAVTGLNRKELSEKVITDVATEDRDSRKLALASDLHWLISEGYVIEFNDGSLDLPRGKAKAQEGAASAGPAPSLSNGPAAEPMEQAFAGVGAPPIPSELEIGGS
ncbi:MAG: hypothetical protein DME75_12460 [Verrucomicrobia bacterium]|nr:MAG: hypothetical protein DME75_12460 [Verrucomicrobiota bacterium]